MTNGADVGSLLDLDDRRGSPTRARLAGSVQWVALDRAHRSAVPHDLPPWAAVYQQTQRWLKAGCFEAIVEDLCAILRLAQGRNEEPSAAIFDSRTLQSSPESGHRAGYDGAKRRKGSKVHLGVDTLGHLLALHVTAVNANFKLVVLQQLSWSVLHESSC